MNEGRLLLVLVLSASLSACGGNDTVVVDCENSLEYQDLTVGKRVIAPEGLDQLDEFREMPVPKADPAAATVAPGTCDDMPPLIRRGG